MLPRTPLPPPPPPPPPPRRPVSVTLARVWAALSLWEKVKLIGQLLWTGLRCGELCVGVGCGCAEWVGGAGAEHT